MVPAIVVAAGLSRRMGRCKLTLPWGESSVIGQVVATLEKAGLHEILVVTGHRAEEVAATLAGTAAATVFNPDYATGEMLSSIQVGLRALSLGVSMTGQAALLCLGDQPQMEVATVCAVLTAGQVTGWGRIVIPSYQMRAGHPILLPKAIWPEILATTESLRAILAVHRQDTHFLVVDTPTVLADLDTPEDYIGG